MSSQVRTYTAKERNMYLVGMMGQNMIYNINRHRAVFLLPVGDLYSGNGHQYLYGRGAGVGRH